MINTSPDGVLKLWIKKADIADQGSPPR